MAERVESGGEGGPDLSELEDTSNVLLLAPSLGAGGTDACLHLLSQSPPERTNVLSIAYSESPDDFVDRWTAGTGGSPSRGGVVGIGTSDESVGDSNWALRPVENPSDLTGVGIELSELLSRMANGAPDDEEIVVCFNNLTTLLQYADLQRTFRFLHVVTGRVKSVDAFGHYHIDPDAHDRQTLATLKGLFDAVVQVDEDGSWSVQR
ncbi:MAG: hypothetical protein ABEH61_04425 [Haloarculaceae archaeon]